ncbi:HdeD family acid-resistance protein [Companilactobacillus sp.]|jgi:uncharacterized membrane protein HdeD (DUF308 family)|uniref:HdeD family acid-resistance protein n=1 Tax=Companilactobacillus sp. TaxID=2767905 RepID=UPI0025C3B1D4|nr:DUF308 domain-containing protein [Companilactobacillus sp.]MCH4009912.1 DUF308 domain-containing protein [Companilactobacillus sp.]MCH4052412.1 DUF308 domain-containing protein [Companilactobacillus sp.]MCH4077854.1 DUF308 domain-containing protein [Companilactobacillus sp.]MCH4126430.1 DUF308 domain-containing protein [Companilactobacillus sp.]MCH4132016.1 DUF308 domain-containing protein [Companilactobacillus sp.]
MVKQFQLYRWLRFIFLATAGILIVLEPTKSLDFIIYIVSAYVAFYGVLSLIDGFSLKRKTGENNMNMGFGVLALIVAILILFVAKFLVALVPPVLGIILLANGINQFRDSHETRKTVNVTPWLDYLYSALLIIAGVVFILNPSKTIIFLYQLFGVALIVLAFFEIINSRLYGRKK